MGAMATAPISGLVLTILAVAFRTESRGLHFQRLHPLFHDNFMVVLALHRLAEMNRSARGRLRAAGTSDGRRNV